MTGVTADAGPVNRDLQSSRVGREYRSRQRVRAIAVAVVCILALALVTTAVFSIAGRSRAVATSSVTLHGLNEALRSMTVVRAQTAFATYLAGVDARYGTDSGRVVTLSAREAADGLDDLGAAIETIGTDEVLDERTSATLAAFMTASRRALADVARGEVERAGQVLRGRAVPAFDTARGRLAERRDEVLSEVTSSGNLLGRLGGLASFLIAFVLPTIAVLVYRQLTARSREAVELAVELGRERNRRGNRQLLVERSLRDVRSTLARDAQAGVQVGDALLAADDAALLLDVLDGTRQYTFSEVVLAIVLEGAAGELRADGIAVRVHAGDHTAWVDPAALRHALRCVGLEARDAGARRIELTARSTSSGAIAIALDHDGARLSGEVASKVFATGAAAQDDEGPGTTPIRLVAALEVLDALDGSLALGPAPGAPAFVVTVPAAETAPAAIPARARLAAAS